MVAVGRAAPGRAVLLAAAVLVCSGSAQAASGVSAPAPNGPTPSQAPAVSPAAPAPAPPGPASLVGLAARAAIVLEPSSGTRIYARHAHQQLPIASTTKLMTAYVVLHRVGLDRVLRVLPYTPTGAETVAGLHAGERLSVRDLLTAMLLPSGGDAAHALAVDLAGTTGRFVAWMNQAAGDLHLADTHFSTEVGLDTPSNHSSVSDLASLTATLLGDRFFARIVARPRAVLADGRVMVNRNDLVGRFGFVVGVKTGHTNAAGYCLVGAGRRHGATVISVVLGDPTTATRDADTVALLRYGLSLYHGVLVVRPGHVYARIPVDGRAGERLGLVPARGVRLVLRRGARVSVYATNVAAAARGPLPIKTMLGQLTVTLAGRVLTRVGLVSRSPIAAPPPLVAATGRILRAGGLIGAALLLVGCSLRYMRKRPGGRGEQ